MERRRSDHSPVIIARMSEADLTAVVALEQACGLPPWGVADYRKELSRSWVVLLVALTSQSVEPPAVHPPLAGFLAGWVAADEFQLHNLAVAARRRRQGIGSALLRAGLRAAREQGASRAVLEVRASNGAAQALYQHHGFALAGRRKDYYRDPLEDAWVLACQGEGWDKNVA